MCPDVHLYLQCGTLLLQFHLNILYHWPCGSGLFELEEDLQQKEHGLNNQEVLRLFKILHDLNDIGHGLPVLLHLIAESSDVVQEYSVCLSA